MKRILLLLSFVCVIGINAAPRVRYSNDNTIKTLALMDTTNSQEKVTQQIFVDAINGILDGLNDISATLANIEDNTKK